MQKAVQGDGLVLLSVFSTQNLKGTCIDIGNSSTWQILLDLISAVSEIKYNDLLDRKFKLTLFFSKQLWIQEIG